MGARAGGGGVDFFSAGAIKLVFGALYYILKCFNFQVAVQIKPLLFRYWVKSLLSKVFLLILSI